MKFTAPVIVFCVLTHLAVAAAAVKDPETDAAIKMMKYVGVFDQISQCLGLEEERLEQLFHEVHQHCNTGSDSRNREQCSVETASELTGINADKWFSCGNNVVGRRREIDPAMPESGRYAYTYVSLPLYPDAIMLVHSEDNDSTAADETGTFSLPVATFVSSDSPAQVLAYYQQHLPGYKLHKYEMSGQKRYAIMQQLPQGFNYTNDFLSAFTIPHVQIQPAGQVEQEQSPGAKTLFLLHYQPVTQ